MNGIKHQVLSDSYDSDGIKSMLISVQSYNSNDNSNVKTNFDNSNNVISNNNNAVNNTKSNENVQNNTYNAASKETGNGIPFGLFILNAASIAIVAAAVSRAVRGKNKLTKK